MICSIFWRFFCDSCLQYHYYQSLWSIHVKGMRLFNLFVNIYLFNICICCGNFHIENDQNGHILTKSGHFRWATAVLRKYLRDLCLRYHHYQSLGSTHGKGMPLFNLFVNSVVTIIQETPKMAIYWHKMAISDELQHVLKICI